MSEQKDSPSLLASREGAVKAIKDTLYNYVKDWFTIEDVKKLYGEELVEKKLTILSFDINKDNSMCVKIKLNKHINSSFLILPYLYSDKVTLLEGGTETVLSKKLNMIEKRQLTTANNLINFAAVKERYAEDMHLEIDVIHGHGGFSLSLPIADSIFKDINVNVFKRQDICHLQSLAPIPPLPDFLESDDPWQDGYDEGYKAGVKARLEAD